MLRQRGRVGLVTAALVGVVVGGAQAQVTVNPPTTEQGAAILIFPKVIADGTRDTIIQITNTGNSMEWVHCFYVNGAPTFPTLPPNPLTNPPQCGEVDFDFVLTKQQPTHWVVSRGRTETASLFAEPCSPTHQYCNDAGLFSGQIPPVIQPFTGELKCIEVDMTGHPVSINKLKGEAEVESANVCQPDPDEPTNHCYIDTDEACAVNSDCEDLYDVSKYNAIGLQGNENNDGDDTLCLGGGESEQCPNGAEYDACPAVWIANHFADDAPDPVAGSGSEVDTDWTFVPCTEDFENQAIPPAPPVTVQIQTYNEFENVFSLNVQFTCWADFDLDDLGNGVQFGYAANQLGTPFAVSRLRSSTNTQTSFMMVQGETHETGDGWKSFADVNNHVEGINAKGDVITIPADQLSIGGVGP